MTPQPVPRGSGPLVITAVKSGQDAYRPRIDRFGRGLDGGGVVCASQKEFFGEKKLKKKEKKIWRPLPQKFRPPKKFQTPPKKISDPP